MSIESRNQFIEKSEIEKKQLEDKIEEAERENAAARAIIRTMEFSEDCDYIKQAVESDYTETVNNYTSNEISGPAESLKSDTETFENEATADSAKLEKGIQSIENIESAGKEIKVNLEDSKREVTDHKDNVEDQKKTLARIKQEFVAAQIRADRLNGLS